MIPFLSTKLLQQIYHPGYYCLKHTINIQGRQVCGMSVPKVFFFRVEMLCFYILNCQLCKFDRFWICYFAFWTPPNLHEVFNRCNSRSMSNSSCTDIVKTTMLNVYWYLILSLQVYTSIIIINCNLLPRQPSQQWSCQ